MKQILAFAILLAGCSRKVTVAAPPLAPAHKYPSVTFNDGTVIQITRVCVSAEATNEHLAQKVCIDQ